MFDAVAAYAGVEAVREEEGTDGCGMAGGEEALEH